MHLGTKEKSILGSELCIMQANYSITYTIRSNTNSKGGIVRPSMIMRGIKIFFKCTAEKNIAGIIETMHHHYLMKNSVGQSNEVHLHRL